MKRLLVLLPLLLVGCNTAVAPTLTDPAGTPESNPSGAEVPSSNEPAAPGTDADVVRDTDADGVTDNHDDCPDTPSGLAVDGNGCGLSQPDSDGDRFSDYEELISIPRTDPYDPTDNPSNIRDTDRDGCSDYDELTYEGFCDNDPNTPLDSDGDGFSDDEEINGSPGTDPYDPTDNPNNVRDTDGDGCSDFDESNFDGFCDNDPNTADGGGGPDISEVLGATWQVLAVNPLDPSAGMIATAFSIDDKRLATNAHVVYAVASVLRAGGVGAVVQHETGTSLEIVNMWVHPEYDGNSVTSPDVGVIEVEGRLPSWMSLADDAIVRNLQILDDVTLCGFPGDVALLIDFANLQPGDEFRPRASCFTGSISSLRPFDPSAPATPANVQLIQHDIATTRGTSGSAVLDDSGSVIAIHAATTTDEGGTNRFAPRSDTLWELIELIDSGSVPPLETEASPGGDGTTVFDVTEVLDGDWVLIGAFTGYVFACMEFDRGVLIFHDALCWIDDFGFMPNHLDFRAEVLSDGHSFVLSYSYTVNSTYDQVIVGDFVDEDHINVFYTTVKRGPSGDEWSFPALLVRRDF